MTNLQTNTPTMLNAAHLNGWTPEIVLDRIPDEELVGDAAVELSHQNLGRGHVASWVPDLPPDYWTCVSGASIFYSRFGDGDVQGRDWEHIRFYNDTGAVIGEVAYPT